MISPHYFLIYLWKFSCVFVIDKKTLSNQLEITAETKDGIIMGVMHKEYNIHGVQFHPESIKTIIGIKILKNFINYKNKWKFS